MTSLTRGVLLSALAGLVLALPTRADDPLNPDTVKDRKAFIPYQVYHPLKGKAIGLLLSDVAPKMGHEGRGGPPDAMGFSVNGGSYRWIYVPVADQPLITNLRVRVGEKGDEVQVYPRLSLANRKTVKQWNIDAANALVEVEVNDGKGAPADEGFVATKMTRLDGTQAYPLKVGEVLEDLKKRYSAHLQKSKKSLDEALEKARKSAIKDEKATGPRETNTLMYATWMADTRRMLVHFRTTITDGAYKYTEGAADIDRPFPLPPPPRQGKPAGRFPKEAFALFPPPPPKPIRVRYGISFGIEMGMAYEVDLTGKVVKTLELTPESFKKELPPPPQLPRRGQPVPLPVKPDAVKDEG